MLDSLDGSKPDSYYLSSARDIQSYPTLKGESKTDVCVIGAGLCGISSALELASQGYRVIVLEAREVAWGASGRSGGQIIFGFGGQETVLEKLVGFSDAKSLWDMSIEGLSLIRQRVRKYSIECDLSFGHLHAAIKAHHYSDLQRWSELLTKRYAYESLQLWDGQELRQHINTERYIGGLFDTNSGHLHPLNYALGLAEAAVDHGAQFFENSQVSNIKEGDELLVTTDQGVVRCRYAIVCCNAYIGSLNRSLLRRIIPIGSFIGATESMDIGKAEHTIRNNMAVSDMNNILDYYRLSADRRLLFGGRVSYSPILDPDLKQSTKRRMLKVFPQLQDVEMEYTWGGMIDMTANHFPDFGRLSKNVYYAQGFSGQGVATTGLAGKLMAEAVMGTAERFDVFTRIPHRNFPLNPIIRRSMLGLAMLWYGLRDMF